MCNEKNINAGITYESAGKGVLWFLTLSFESETKQRINDLHECFKTKSVDYLTTVWSLPS
jgi:hypothetical protein